MLSRWANPSATSHSQVNPRAVTKQGAPHMLHVVRVHLLCSLPIAATFAGWLCCFGGYSSRAYWRALVHTMWCMGYLVGCQQLLVVVATAIVSICLHTGACIGGCYTHGRAWQQASVAICKRCRAVPNSNQHGPLWVKVGIASKPSSNCIGCCIHTIGAAHSPHNTSQQPASPVRVGTCTKASSVHWQVHPAIWQQPKSAIATKAAVYRLAKYLVLYSQRARHICITNCIGLVLLCLF